MHAYLRRIAIATLAAIATVASSAAIAHSQIRDGGTYKSMADCEAAMQRLLQSGRIRWYQCSPLEQTTQPQIAPTRRQLRVNILSEQLGKKWKHRSNFGINTTKKNAATLPYYRQAIIWHLSRPQTIAYGTYQYSPGSKVYFNPITNLAVILDRNNNFVSGWRLIPGTAQFRNYINEGVLR